MEFINFVSLDECRCCHTKGLSLIDSRGQAFKVSFLQANQYLFNKKEFSHIYCSTCNKNYFIDWRREDRLPRQFFGN